MLQQANTADRSTQDRGAVAVSHRTLLGQCITLVIFSTLIALIATLAIRDDVPLSIYALTFGPFIATYVAALILLRFDRVTAAGWLFMVGTFVGQLGAVVVAEGYRGQAHVSFVNLVLVAGFTMGTRIAALITVTSVALVSGYSLVDQSIFVGLSLVEQDAASQTVALASSIFTTGGLVIIGMRHFQIGMRRLETASHTSLKSQAIAERAQYESSKRAQLAESLAGLGRSIIELRTSDSVAILCCKTVLNSLAWDTAILLDQNGLIMGGYPEDLGNEKSTHIHINVKEKRWMTADECNRIGRHFNDSDFISGYACPVQTPFSQHTLVLLAKKSHELAPSELSFLQTATQLLGAGLGRVIAEERLVRSQKMDVVDRLSAGIAHDLNNYLMAIVTGVQLVELKLDRKQHVTDHLKLISKTSESASALIRKLTNFTQARPRHPEPIELKSLISELPIVMTQSGDKDIRFEIEEPDEPLWVFADPVDIEQVTLNLLLNASDAVSQNGTVKLELYGDEHQVFLVVEDDGHGIPEQVKGRIFEPFFTTRDNQGGSGLGLTMVYALARASGGDIEVITAAGEGTRFEISFPRHHPVALTEDPVTPLKTEHANKRILVVEDDREVGDMLSEMLIALNYQVTRAHSGDEALDMLTTPSEYDLILSDVVMPGMSGIELLTEVKRRNIGVPSILMSGYTPRDVSAQSPGHHQTELRKPFTVEQLSNAIDSVVGQAVRQTASGG